MTSPIIQKLLSLAIQNPDKVILSIWNDKLNKFSSISWIQYFSQILCLSIKIENKIIKDKRPLMILLNNSLEWDLIEKVCFYLDIPFVAIESTTTKESINKIFLDIRPIGIFGESFEQVNRLSHNDLKGLSILCFRDEATTTLPCDSWSDFFAFKLEKLENLKKINLVNSLDNKNMSIIVYSSGSSGTPKKITYNQKQILDTCIEINSHQGGWGKNQTVLSWLPMANLFQRITNLSALLNNSQVYIFSPPQQVALALKKVRPTIFIAVPRFYEKLQLKLLTFKRKIAWLPQFLQIFILRFILLKFFRSNSNLISGSSALKPSTFIFFKKLGFNILESYGLSECIMPIAMNTPAQNQPGSVGKPLKSNSLSFSDSNEIRITSSYLTPVVGTPSHHQTGDIGYIDKLGFLHLKGRTSKIIKLSTGRKIFREEIEKVFDFNDNIDHFLIFGNERPFCVALVTLSNNRNPSKKWVDRFEKYLENFNQKLSETEQIRGYLLINKPLSIEESELTFNLKVKHNLIEKKYSKELDTIYTNIEYQYKIGNKK